MEQNNGVREVSELGGLAKSMPVVATLFLVFGLSSIGLPLTNGFIGEFMSIAGVFKVSPAVGIFATISVIFSALYLLSVYRQVFFGRSLRSGVDISGSSIATYAPALVLVFLLGAYPAPVLSGVKQSILSISNTSPQIANALGGAAVNRNLMPARSRDSRMDINSLRNLMFSTRGARR